MPAVHPACTRSPLAAKLCQALTTRLYFSSPALSHLISTSLHVTGQYPWAPHAARPAQTMSSRSSVFSGNAKRCFISPSGMIFCAPSNASATL